MLTNQKARYERPKHYTAALWGVRAEHHAAHTALACYACSPHPWFGDPAPVCLRAAPPASFPSALSMPMRAEHPGRTWLAHPLPFIAHTDSCKQCISCINGPVSQSSRRWVSLHWLRQKLVSAQWLRQKLVSLHRLRQKLVRACSDQGPWISVRAAPVHHPTPLRMCADWRSLPQLHGRCVRPRLRAWDRVLCINPVDALEQASFGHFWFRLSALCSCLPALLSCLPALLSCVLIPIVHCGKRHSIWG